MYEAFLCKADGTLEENLTVEQIAQALKDETSMLWVDIPQADDTDIDLLTVTFKLHPLTVEDCILPNVRPKLEKFDHYFFINMFAIESTPETKKQAIKTVELDCCLGKNFLITFHLENLKAVSTIKEKVKKQSPIMKQGPDYLLYNIMDTMAENYFPVINMLDNKVDEMSDELFKDPTNETLRKIYNLKNEVMSLRRTLGPQADTIGLLLRGDFPFITAANIVYFRNISDNFIRLNDIVGTSRDIITGALEAYVSVVSNRLNEIMKTLTVIATIMMPLTLIASIYGMNFKFMPELDDRYAYPIVIGSMILIAVIMLYYFKRKKWL
jgi:magnesium transporter